MAALSLLFGIAVILGQGGPSGGSPASSGMLVRGPEPLESTETPAPESTFSPVGSTGVTEAVGSTVLPSGSTEMPETTVSPTSPGLTIPPLSSESPMTTVPQTSPFSPVSAESTELPSSPESTELPVSSSSPESTESPVSSSSPLSTESPVSSYSPVSTQSPASLSSPVPQVSTESPLSNEAIVVSSSPPPSSSPVSTESPVSPASLPIVITTWDYQKAVAKAWQVLQQEKRSALDAVEEGCSLCEAMQCRGTVGYGGSPDEAGETTLDAMIMDGVTMNVGGVAALRRVRSAISVARRVMDSTAHSLLAGSQATRFALQMGFAEETLSTSSSQAMWKDWLLAHCQPNFWRGGLVPDPRQYCGPYRPLPGAAAAAGEVPGDAMRPLAVVDTWHHDTIGMVAMDVNGHLAAGTSTNGARHKIAGRVGDSPIPGAGAYADQEVGAAAATGDGDIMMRFVPSFLAVELMRGGASPEDAANAAIRRIASRFPDFSGALIVLGRDGRYAAACHNLPVRSFPNGFPLTLRTPAEDKVAIKYYECQGNATAPLQASVSAYS